jgi:hypothetical protein
MEKSGWVVLRFSAVRKEGKKQRQVRKVPL